MSNNKGDKMKTKKVVITKDKEDEVPVEVLERAILDIAAGARILLNSRLTERAIILLVQDAAGPTYVSKGQVKEVLKAASQLKDHYIK
jgi:hypothetical protein